MSDTIRLNWQKFKAILDEQGSPYYYYGDETLYIIVTMNAAFRFECSIDKNAEALQALEFETNYKDGASTYDNILEQILTVLEQIKDNQGV